APVTPPFAPSSSLPPPIAQPVSAPVAVAAPTAATPCSSPRRLIVCAMSFAPAYVVVLGVGGGTAVCGEPLVPREQRTPGIGGEDVVDVHAAALRACVRGVAPPHLGGSGRHGGGGVP